MRKTLSIMLRSMFVVILLLVAVTVVLSSSSQGRASHKRKKQFPTTPLTNHQNYVVSTRSLLTPRTSAPAADLQIKLQEENTITCAGGNSIIRAGYVVNGTFQKLYSTCFDRNRLEVLYVEHELDPSVKVTKRDNFTRIKFKQDSFYPNVDVETIYTKKYQIDKIGSKYIKGNNYLARGHLAAVADYGAAIDQLCTFYYINTAPQWQSFNNANWKSLENSLRQRFIKAGYNTVIYTGTYGVLKLPDASNKLIDIYLDHERNKIPVPLYFYKVVYDKFSKNGTAFVGINNPYCEDYVASLTFCTDRCRDNLAFNWLTWKPDVVSKGYSFCCTIDDFGRTVLHLPSLTTNGLLV